MEQSEAGKDKSIVAVFASKSVTPKELVKIKLQFRYVMVLNMFILFCLKVFLFNLVFNVTGPGSKKERQTGKAKPDPRNLEKK